MDWPFKRKPEPQPPINEDWRVGDLAECINNHPWMATAPRTD